MKCFRMEVELDDTSINRVIGYFPAMNLDDAYVAASNLLVNRSPENFILPSTANLLDALVDHCDNFSVTELSKMVHKRLLPLLPAEARHVSARHVAHAVDQIQRHGTLKDASIKKLVTLLARAYSWGLLNTALKRNPAREFLDHAKQFRGSNAIFKISERPQVPYTPQAQVVDLIDTLEMRAIKAPPGHTQHALRLERLAYARFILLTGMRRDEARQLNKKEIYPDEPVPFVSMGGHRKKNARAHSLALSDRALEVLGTLTPCPRGFYFPGLCRQDRTAVSVYFSTLGVKLHSLRYTVAHNLGLAGCPEKIVALILSHTEAANGPATMTQRYMAMDPDFHLAEQHKWLTVIAGLAFTNA
jgi:integrase